MAERLFSRIKRRAFSWRAARSSIVMGLASPRSVRSAAMAGGRDLSFSAACARVGKVVAPRAREPDCKKWRRESMKTPEGGINYIEWLIESRASRLGGTGGDARRSIV